MEKTTQKKTRILFLDTLRAVAIVFMLQGHFIGIVLEYFSHYKQQYFSEGTSGFFIFDFWFKIKVYTAPLFFMISGIVFVYLLTLKPEDSFRKKRIKKGILRSIKLIFIGYLLQFNLLHFKDTFENETPWLYAFHVLQCIGVGILLLCLICYLHNKSKIGKLWMWYLTAFTACVFLSLRKDLITQQAFFINAPLIIQNTISGKFAVFPVIPWLSFIFFGGLVGTLLHLIAEKIEQAFYIRFFMIVGLSIHLMSTSGLIRYIDLNLYDISLSSWGIYKILWIFRSIGLNLFLIGFCNLLLKNKHIRAIPFSFMGKDTLLIYNLHVILLYGGFFGIGLDLILKEKLSPIESVFGAIVFIAFFYLVTWAHQKVRKTHRENAKIITSQT